MDSLRFLRLDWEARDAPPPVAIFRAGLDGPDVRIACAELWRMWRGHHAALLPEGLTMDALRDALDAEERWEMRRR